MAMARNLPDLHGVFILVMDDNDDTRDILATYLQHLGAVVTTARNVGEALAALDEVRAHVIVSDLTMPVMDGYEFVARLRRMPGEDQQPTPVIAFSGYTDEAQRAIENGFVSFIAKPSDPLTVAREIQRFARPA